MIFDSEDNNSSFSEGESTKDKYEERVLMANFRATLEAKVQGFNKLCWDVCVDKTGAKLDDKTATCLSNCVERFLDVSNFIGQRYILSLQKH